MVDVIGRAKVIVSGDVDSRSIDDAGGKIGESLKRGAVIGVAALGTLAVAGVKAFQNFEQAEAQSRKLTQVLDNMGKSNAAPAVEALADEIQRLTGVGDDLIKDGQVILTTFSNVAESAGEVGGTFERATRASVDLAAAGFGTVESASVMLGKALQAPVQGVSALGEAGVTFTEKQKELIAGFVEANDVASAQAIILAEVEKQVKGAGEANATESAKIAAAWDDVQESVGLALSELTGGEVGSFSEALLKLAEAIEDLGESEGWEDTGKALRDLNRQFNDNSTFLGRWRQDTKTQVKSLGDLAEGAGNTASRIKSTWKGLPGLFKSWGDSISDTLGNLIDEFQEVWEWHTRIGDVDVPDAPDISQPRETRAGGGPVQGFALVGVAENGPELVQFGGSGGYVYNNSQTRDILAGAGGDTNITNLIFNGPASLSEARREQVWANSGTRFGGATQAGAR